MSNNSKSIGIQIYKYPQWIKIGCSDQEKLSKTKILCSIDIEYQLNHFKFLDDDLSEVIDYHKLIKFINIKTQNIISFNLLESYADYINNQILNKYKIITSISTCVEKTIYPPEVTKENSKVKVTVSQKNHKTK